MTTVLVVAAVILLPAIFKAVMQGRRERRFARLQQKREAHLASLGIAFLPGTGLSQDTIRRMLRQKLLS